MNKLSLFLFAALALTFTSCVEENILVERDLSSELELPDNPVDLTRTDANELVGAKFGMAQISLTSDTRSTEFSMIGCELSVLEAGSEGAPAISRIDESALLLALAIRFKPTPLMQSKTPLLFLAWIVHQLAVIGHGS